MEKLLGRVFRTSKPPLLRELAAFKETFSEITSQGDLLHVKIPLYNHLYILARLCKGCQSEHFIS